MLEMIFWILAVIAMIILMINSIMCLKQTIKLNKEFESGKMWNKYLKKYYKNEREEN